MGLLYVGGHLRKHFIIRRIKMKIMVKGIVSVLFVLVFIACASQQQSGSQYDIESYFLVEEIDNGKAVRIDGYIGRNRNIRIPPQINNLPVVEIGSSAFAKKNLTSISIPDGVRSIGNTAFSLNNLTSIIIPDSVTAIGGMVFDSKVTNITIGANVTLAQFSFTAGGFIELYEENGRKAGTYTWSNGRWNAQYR
jgi:hypothetical protein